MFSPAWYRKTFAPLIEEWVAKSPGEAKMSQERFLEWINSNKDRKAKHAGIQWFVNDHNEEEWNDILRECMEMCQ